MKRPSFIRADHWISAANELHCLKNNPALCGGSVGDVRGGAELELGNDFLTNDIDRFVPIGAERRSHIDNDESVRLGQAKALIALR